MTLSSNKWTCIYTPIFFVKSHWSNLGISIHWKHTWSFIFSFGWMDGRRRRRRSVLDRHMTLIYERQQKANSSCICSIGGHSRQVFSPSLNRVFMLRTPFLFVITKKRCAKLLKQNKRNTTQHNTRQQT